MTAHKEAESRWKFTANRYGIFTHKFGDVRYCIYCHKPLPKSELKPDYVCGIIAIYVECKNSDGTGRWAWSEISSEGERKNQRTFLLENSGWLFIQLGDKPAPDGKSAYLLPFSTWVEEIEPVLIARNQKSIRKTDIGERIGGDEVLAEFRLIWVSGGWEIPKGHHWWSVVHNKLAYEIGRVQSML
jgi:hypothetical protein